MLYSGYNMVIAHMNSQHRSRQLKIPPHRQVGLMRSTLTKELLESRAAGRGENNFSWGGGNWNIASAPGDNNSHPCTYAYTDSTNRTL